MRLQITGCGARRARLRLINDDGAEFLHEVDFDTFRHEQRQALFDLRNYHRCHKLRAQKGISHIAEIGVLIAQQVLGPAIFHTLWNNRSPQFVNLELPAPDTPEGMLPALMTRIPWEAARPTPDQEDLDGHNMRLRIKHTLQACNATPLPLLPGEALRVLMVFADGPHSMPLTMRMERHALRKLFVQKILPYRQVEVHELVHDVSRARLREHLREHGGCHILHWSGHGAQNRLELRHPDGSADETNGEELLDLFFQAGVAIPQFVFLSACHSGELPLPGEWLQQALPTAGEILCKTHTRSEIPDYGTVAHALLQAGIPAVAAMRYEVGDEYARSLAIKFYQSLLADARPKDVASALQLARKEVFRNDTQGVFMPCDHYTAILYGCELPAFAPTNERSRMLSIRNRQLNPMHRLQPAPYFVGRSDELNRLARYFAADSEVSMIHLSGPAGIGKSTLLAEVVDLWQANFDWVLAFSAPDCETFLRQTHEYLAGEGGRYLEHIQTGRGAPIYRPPGHDCKGLLRRQTLHSNLVQAMHNEAILLILDDFDTQLRSHPTDGVYPACDPAWDELLQMLQTGLYGSRSKVLLASKQKPVLSGAIPELKLGHLPTKEAQLYLRCHPQLRQWYLSGDQNQEWKAGELLKASIFHPGLMGGLASMAQRPELQTELSSLVEKLTQFPLNTEDAAYPSRLQSTLTTIHHLLKDQK